MSISRAAREVVPVQQGLAAYALSYDRMIAAAETATMRTAQEEP